MNASYNSDGTVSLKFPYNLTVTITIEQAKKLSSKLSGCLVKTLRPDTKSPYIACRGKRSFPSKESARLHNSGAGWRIRPYYCEVCSSWHVTNSDKAGNGESRKFR